MHRFEYQMVKARHDEVLRGAAERRRAARPGTPAPTAPTAPGTSPARRRHAPRGLGRLRPANRW